MAARQARNVHPRDRKSTRLNSSHWKSDSKAVITGITFGTDKNHIARAALESIAYQVRDVISAMVADSELPLKELMADGGVTSNNFVMQFIADLLETNVRNIGMEDVSALGAAYMAGLGSGLYKTLEEIKEIPHQQKRFVPGDKRKLAQEFYKEWQAAVKSI